jgi:hypothetical protein
VTPARKGIIAAILGAIAGTPAFIAYYGVFVVLSIPYSCASGGRYCIDWTFSIAFLLVPAFLAVFDAIVVYRLLHLHRAASAIRDGLIIGLVPVFDIWVASYIIELWTAGPL